jgi:hypothetical protein
MAKAGEVSFLGNSRTVYKFGVYTLDTNFTDIGAVYIFCSTNAKGQHQPRYVGATGELGHHIQDYNQWPRIRQCDVKCICVRVDKSESSRASIASDLIAYYNPVGNSG